MSGSLFWWERRILSSIAKTDAPVVRIQAGRAPQRGCPAGDPACLRSQDTAFGLARFIVLSSFGSFDLCERRNASALITLQRFYARPPLAHADAARSPRHISQVSSGAREDGAAGNHLWLSRRRSPPGREARVGATQSIRSGGAVDAIERRAERDHWRRQFDHRGNNWRHHAAGCELPCGTLSFPSSAA